MRPEEPREPRDRDPRDPTGLPAGLITVFIATAFAGLWFAFPLARR